MCVPDQPKWNQDHTVLAAMRPSVLWFFQTMAPRIGAARAHDWLQRFHYGNSDTVFASAVWRPKGGVDTLDATRLAVKTFVARAVLQSRGK